MTKEEAKEWLNKCIDLNLKKENKELKQEIIDQTLFLPIDAPIQQRLWHIINAVSVPIKCTTKNCINLVKWAPSIKRYNMYCSATCASTDPDKVARSQAWKQNPQKLQNANVKGVQNRQATNLSLYGHTNYLASEEGKSKSILGKIEKYGEDFRQQEFQKRTETMVEKYGVPSFTITEDFQEKIKAVCLEKYGVPSFKQQPYIDLLDKINSVDYLIDQHQIEKKPFVQISNELNGFDSSTLLKKIRKYQENFTPTRFYVSTGEKQISQFLTDNNINHLTNIRNIIAPLELDIYIPEYNLAIEYCGLYWHSEQQGKDRQYHKTKHDLCQKQGIQLLTIYEDEWQQRNIQVKRKLLHLVGQNITKIFARKTTVIILDREQKDLFFNEHHIQGTGPGSIVYGLEYDNTIVSAMTFIKNKDNSFYLNRYATSVTVVGGFSKLLKHFQKNNEWIQIISFADQRWSNGNLYEMTGFVLDSILPPDYYYSPDGHNRYHKFNYRRKNLPKLLNYFDPNLSETINCNVNGILRIWDCGKRRYVINNN